MHAFYAYAAILIATYAVVGNDSIQNLGAFISSTEKHWSWQFRWFGTALIFVVTMVVGWAVNHGDMSFGLLARVPYVQVEWYHLLAPATLLVLTRVGVPVSTSFLCLSVFTPDVVLQSMLEKSVYGYIVAALTALVVWFGISAITRRYFADVTLSPAAERRWRIAQLFAMGLLWNAWIRQDMSNVSVFLPRDASVYDLMFVLSAGVVFLGVIFWSGGGKIQRMLRTKSNTRFVIAATTIDLVFALILIGFKEYSNIPMSTTWVFVGLLTGREVAIRAMYGNKKKKRKLFPMILADLSKVSFGAFVSVALVFFVRDRWAEVSAFVLAHSSPALVVLVVTVVGVMIWATVRHHQDPDGYEEDLHETDGTEHP